MWRQKNLNGLQIMDWYWYNSKHDTFKTVYTPNLHEHFEQNTDV